MNSTLADQAARADQIYDLETSLTASRAECEGLRQRYVDANEALIDTEQALVRIADAMVLPVVRAALSQKETGDA